MFIVREIKLILMPAHVWFKTSLSPGGLEFDSLTDQIELSVVITAMFLRSCVAQALSCGDGSRHSLRAPSKYREYNEE